MRILVDTSTWIDFFNGHRSPHADSLAGYIEDRQSIATCGVILAEFFQGLRDRKSYKTLEVYFRELDLVVPREPDTYFAAAALYRNLRARGVTVRSTIDCLIACLAEEHECLLLSKDRDMSAILDSGLCSVRSAPLLRT